MVDYNILLGGEAGQGMNTVGGVLEKIFTRTGYYIFATKDYMSRIRGGHNFNCIRISDEPIYTHRESIDMLIAFNEETIELHEKHLLKDGLVIDEKAYPFKELAKEIGNIKVIGTVMVGAVIKMLGLSTDIAEGVLKEYFSGDILRMNISALEKGYDLVDKKVTLPSVAAPKKTITLNGNQAVGLGALAAGCKFFSGYPMTPGTGIMNYIAAKQHELGIVVEQSEDEIAALNMVIGASYAGVRAMTSTSGGGYSLMVEAVGLSGIIETPAVIANVQRPGPATGLPTRTAQGDLHFVLYASQDEIPRMVIALRSVEEAFYQTIRAFNLADKYQIPVTILSDQYLADAQTTILPYDFSAVKIEKHLADVQGIGKERYKRYKITEDGISPRIIPGKIPGQVVMVDSDEHDEYGHIIESDTERIQMMDKRMQKIETLKSDIQEPWYVGSEKPETLIVGWGSTYCVIKTVIEALEKQGKSIGALIYGDVCPLPVALFNDYAANANNIIAVEGNYSGQLADLIQQKTCIPIKIRLTKYDGRAWGYEELQAKIQEVL